MATLTLLRREHPLAAAGEQLRILDAVGGQPPFHATLARQGQAPLRATGLQVLQVNVGKLCNQTCRHCHVDAGPDRRESMPRPVFEACLNVLRQTEIPVVDVTGGAPEMNPHFRWFVAEVRRLGRHVIDRCNLTILTAPGFEDLVEFLAEQRVEIVASLPCYLEQNTDAQRGEGVFRRSLEALRRLNALGYGVPESGRVLNLVFNPLGPSLPPAQPALEAAYRHELQVRYGVVFNRLFTITNMPISRFLEDLQARGETAAYLQKLVTRFNPETIAGLMCRTTLSVDWRGRLFDCDFNQMLDLELVPEQPRTVFEFDAHALRNRAIATGQHCYGCTAGAGSSCQGALAGGAST